MHHDIEQTEPNKTAKRGYSFILIAGLFWGTTGLFIEQLTRAGASNSLISVLRVGTALILMLPIVWKSCGLAALRIPRKTLLMCVAMGFCSQTVFNICYTAAVNSVGVATSAVLLYASLFFVCIFSRIIFKEIITAHKILGITVNIVGCVLTVTGGDFSALSFVWFGTIMGLGAALGGGSIVIFGKILTDDTHPYVITFYNLLFGFIFLLPFLAGPGAGSIALSGRIILLGFAMGLASACIPEVLFMTGLSHPVEASKVNVFASMEIILASLIGIFAFHEFINAWKLVGMALVLCSILIINLSPAISVKQDASEA